MNKGTVKFFNETKGFGFIKDANSEKEYFVHSSGLIDFVKGSIIGIHYSHMANK